MNAPLDTSISELANVPASTADVPAVPTVALTQEGRVIKNIHKIEGINSHVESRIVATFYSWQVSREMRRDFNLLSAKIVTRARSQSTKRQIHEMLMEMRLQAQLLQTEAERFPIMQLASPEEVSLRIVAPLAALLYRVFNEADLSIARLTEASKSGIIMQSNQESIVAPFFIAYKDLKGYLLGSAISNTKTAAQLGQEIGIS
jgi:hypothetical protein